MKLFFCAERCPEDDADCSIFVWAANEQDAARHWKNYYTGWDLPDAVYVYTVPTRGMVGAVPWGVLVTQQVTP
jgi:hypothetical protein